MTIEEHLKPVCWRVHRLKQMCVFVAGIKGKARMSVESKQADRTETANGKR